MAARIVGGAAGWSPSHGRQESADITARISTGVLQAERLSNKVVVLDFSAEWCGICKTQIPVREVSRRSGTVNGHSLCLVSGLAQAGEADQAGQTAAKFSFSLLVGCAATWQTDGPIGGAWNVLGWPATYVIGATTSFDLSICATKTLEGRRQLLESKRIATLRPRARRLRQARMPGAHPPARPRERGENFRRRPRGRGPEPGRASGSPKGRPQRASPSASTAQVFETIATFFAVSLGRSFSSNLLPVAGAVLPSLWPVDRHLMIEVRAQVQVR